MDVANQTSKIPDGTISRNDLKAIRDDEENSDELREAAGFLLDDDTLFDFFESGEQQASSHRFQIGRNDLFIHYDNNATQADAYDAWLTLNG